MSSARRRYTASILATNIRAKPMLDPQARALLDLMIERRIPEVWTLTPEEARRLYRERRFFTQPTPPSMVGSRDLSLPGPAGALPARLYRPPGLRTPAPVLIYFHGGGWVIGDLDTHDVLCRQLAVAGHCAVLAVDYRLSPEAAFPAAVDDCLAATLWVQAEGAALGLDAGAVAAGGDSAGGNLAAVVCLLLREAARPMPRLQLLIYPATDQRFVTASYQANGQGYLLTAESMQYYRGQYLPDAEQWLDWRASPLLAASHAGLPPALVLTAGYDPLRDEGRQYADRLSAAGVPAQYLCFERQIHGFITMSRVLDEAYSAVGLCGMALRRAFMPAV
jgi:acetyl esterase